MRIRTIRIKLFYSYSILIIAITLVFVLSFYIYTSRILENRASESIHQVSGYISSQLDSIIENMDRMSMEVVFSDSIQENFFKDLSGSDDTTLFYNQRELNKILYSILGPWIPPARQINLFNFEGRFIGIGSSSKMCTFPVEKIRQTTWVKNVISKNGEKYITPPHKDDWANHEVTIVSLSRLFSNTISISSNAVVEVQQNYSVISDTISKAVGNNIAEKKVYVFDSDGSIIYPYEKSNKDEASFYWENIQDPKVDAITHLITNPNITGKEMLTYTCSEYTGWTTALVESERTVLSPVIAFRNLISLAGVGLLLVTLIISFFVAKSLTTPIKLIYHSIQDLSFETLSPATKIKLHSGLNELEELSMEFQNMCSRLKNSLAEVVSARSYEIQARMLALQSKMNPHFLYNTLMTICIMAEQKGDTDVVEICEDLSKMLRYILSETPMSVTIGEEVNYTMSYLKLMGKRYKDHLGYTFDIPDLMTDIKVPKMILQPLVENCMKYGINVPPPWEIHLNGKCYGNKWEISVHDNGSGFDEDRLIFLKKRLANVATDNNISDTNLDGIGLVNIYKRLKLLYGDQVIFELSNHPTVGALVTIGGMITNVRDKK